jgi:Sulfotransferase domain
MFSSARGPIERLQFIVAGAQKSGTTALNYYLKRHSRIALPVKKELHFFDNDVLFANPAAVSYEPLHQMFRRARPDCVAGENTPNYLYWPPALERIHAYNPVIKIVIILRNPIDRAFSQWNMQRVRGLEPLDFLDAIRAEPARLARLPPEKLRKFAYVDRGRYGAQLQRALTIFPREQLLILKYEQFRARQRESVAEVFRFLALRPPSFRQIEAHDISYQRKIRPEERVMVFEMLRNDIKQVEEITHWDCSDWR